MNIDRLVKRTAIVVFLLCVAGVVMAGITTTEQPVQYLIRLADKSYEKGKVVPKTIEECRARAKAILPHADCVTIEAFDNVGDCTDVPKPKWAVELTPEGYIVKPAFRSKFKDGSDTEFTHEVEDFVPAPFPECWAKGWRVAMEADFTDDVELANTDDPVTVPPAIQAAWNASCEERHRVNIYYEGEVCT